MAIEAVVKPSPPNYEFHYERQLTRVRRSSGTRRTATLLLKGVMSRTSTRQIAGSCLLNMNEMPNKMVAWTSSATTRPLPSQSS